MTPRALLAALLFACTPSQEPPPSAPTPTPAAAPSPSPSTSPPPAPPPPSDPASVPSARVAAAEPEPTDPNDAKAWTDAIVVKALAANCRWAPPKPVDDDASILTCRSSLFMQSCVADPCFDKDQVECKPKCLATCEGCASTCAAGCESCKAKCGKGTDGAACKTACAAVCGACRQECLRTKDQCATGTCGKLYDECSKRLQARWRASSCKSDCLKLDACLQACTGDQCSYDACRKKLGLKCPPDLVGLCFNGAPPGMTPEP